MKTDRYVILMIALGMDVDRAFKCGIALALAELVRMHDQPTMAADVLAGCGFEKADFKHVDPFDRKKINKLYREEYVLEPKGKRKA